MQLLEVSGAVRPIYGSLGVKRLNCCVWKRVISLNKNKIGEKITGQKRNSDKTADQNSQVSCRCKVASKLILSFVLRNERY